MLVDELLFQGAPVAHVSAYYERVRLGRIEENARLLGRRRWVRRVCRP